MPEITGAIVGALAIVGIPLFAWLSQRITREGRLMLRVERLGKVYALMPDSAERNIFEAHYSVVISNLNTWLEPGNAKRRRIVLFVSGATYVVGVVIALIVLPHLDTKEEPWLPSVAGVLIGVLIASVSFGVAYLLERGARKEEARQGKLREDASAVERMKAISRGESSMSS